MVNECWICLCAIILYLCIVSFQHFGSWLRFRFFRLLGVLVTLQSLTCPQYKWCYTECKTGDFQKLQNSLKLPVTTYFFLLVNCVCLLSYYNLQKKLDLVESCSFSMWFPKSENFKTPHTRKSNNVHFSLLKMTVSIK